MKKNLLLFVLLGFVLVNFTSCDDNNDDEVTTSNTITTEQLQGTWVLKTDPNSVKVTTPTEGVDFTTFITDSQQQAAFALLLGVSDLKSISDLSTFINASSPFTNDNELTFNADGTLTEGPGADEKWGGSTNPLVGELSQSESISFILTGATSVNWTLDSEGKVITFDTKGSPAGDRMITWNVVSYDGTDLVVSLIFSLQDTMGNATTPASFTVAATFNKK